MLRLIWLRAIDSGAHTPVTTSRNAAKAPISATWASPSSRAVSMVSQMWR